jgi:polar amino acid transport system substrate-binding protein
MSTQERRVGPAGLSLLVSTILVGIFVYYLSSKRVSHDNTLEQIRTTGVVRIGYANEAPYGFLDSRTNQITGESPEIARVILKRMGATSIEPVVTEFGSLIPGLKAGRFDVIAAGMYITPPRAQEIDFSDPTYVVGESFIVAAGNPLDLHSFEQVAAHDGARLGIMGGSVEHGYAKALGVPDARIVVFPDYPSAIEGLKTDRVDAVAATILTANDLLIKADDSRLVLATPFEDPIIDGESVKGYGAFGFRPGDDSFREAFNRQLADFIGTDEHLELVRPFGFTRETLPGDVSATEIVERKTRGVGATP